MLRAHLCREVGLHLSITSTAVLAEGDNKCSLITIPPSRSRVRPSTVTNTNDLGDLQLGSMGGVPGVTR